jgi:localization factor PodJL
LDSLIIDAAVRQDAPANDHRFPAPLGSVARIHPSRIGDAGFSIRKDIDELKWQMSRRQLEPAIFEQRLHDLDARINELQSSTRRDDIVEAMRRHFAEFRGSLKEMGPPVEEIAKVWRQDLLAISAALKDAMPTSAIVALEREVRELGERLEAHRGAEAPAETADIEMALASIRERLQALTPAEKLAELSHAVKLLTCKADSIVTESTAPEKMQQLEHAIGALRGIASQVASRDVIAALSDDIRALGDKIDRCSRPAVDADFMDTLERRLAEIAEAVGRCRPVEGASVPANFDVIIKALADRLETTQIPAVDHAALKGLEQRMDLLVDKLERSEARSDSRDGADCAMDELLVQLRELRTQNESRFVAFQQQVATTAADAISGPAESIRRDVASLKEIQTSVDRRTQDTFEAVYGTIEQVVDRLASIEEGLRDGQHVPDAYQSADSPEWRGEAAAAEVQCPSAAAAEAPSLVPSAAPMADRAATEPAIESRGERDWTARAPSGFLSADASAAVARLRHPAASSFAPDAPLEPGSGARRAQVVASAIDRIAASEAMNAAAKPAEAAVPGRASFVAAARRAAQVVASEHQGTPAARFENTIQNSRSRFQANTLLRMLRPRTRSLVLGVSVIMLVFGALGLALDLFRNPGVPEPARPITQADEIVAPGSGEAVPSEPPAVDQPEARKGANLQSQTLPAPINANTFPDDTKFAQAPKSGVLPDEPAAPAIPPLAVTGTLASTQATAADVSPVGAFSTIRNPLLQGPAGRDAVSETTAVSAAPRDLTEIPLPPTIGGKALIAAASAGEPGASYEVAVRFAQGRNAPPNLAMAAAWFERAARSGMAPAQFRLGSMYEKGLGIKKDLTEARRLYLAAADKGNAKAMYNLAVLYAEGLDGKPDYAVASQWFRRAAAHGIIDSQYNLAILYARGVGVERNAAESYKWFALAARGGDKEAARKRDEMAARLDPKQLESAKLSVESFIAEPQPDEATATKAPAGGWDQVVAAATTKSRAAR